MYPWIQAGVKELRPLLPHMKDQRLAEEQVLQTKTSSHTSEIKQVPGWVGQGSLDRGKVKGHKAFSLVLAVIF